MIDPSNCYCVCHTSISSSAYCEHCKGDNTVGRVPRCASFDLTNGNDQRCVRALPCEMHANKKVTDMKAGDVFIICGHIVQIQSWMIDSNE